MPATASARRRAATLPLVLAAAVTALTVGVGASPASAAVMTYSNTTPVAIPDSTSGLCWSATGAGVATSTITVPDGGTIQDVQVALDIAHPFRGDLVVDVTSPTGTTVRLLEHIGAPSCGAMGALNATLSDAATVGIQNYAAPGTYVPLQPLSAFDGQNSAGVWTLRVMDTSGLDTGTLTSWGLAIEIGARFSVADATAAEDGSAVFTVTRSGDITGTDTVDYATVNGSATAGADFIAAAGTLTFAPGVQSLPVAVALIDDAVEELDETFGIALSNPAGTPLPVIGVANATMTITDDDQVTPQFRVVGPATIDENAGSVTFTVTRSESTLRTDSVDFAALAGTAVPGSDYVAASGTLTFASGETTKTVTIGIVDDVVDEGDETFELRLGNPAGTPTPTIPTDRAVVTIVDDDDPAVFSVVGPATAVAENAGSVVFTVTRTVSTTRTDTVDYATFAGTAATGSDFVPTTGTLTFAPGEATKTVAVALMNDAIHENPETFELRLSNPAGVVTPTIAVASATATIADDDPPPAAAANLPDTGADASGAALLAAVLLGAGLVMTLVRRRPARA